MGCSDACPAILRINRWAIIIVSSFFLPALTLFVIKKTSTECPYIKDKKMHYYFYATIAAGFFTLAAFCIGRCIQMRKNSSSNKSHWQFKFNIPAFCLNIGPLIFGIYVLASAEGERTSELDKNHAYPENYCYPLMWKAFLAVIITSSIFLAYCFVEILIIRCCLWDVAEKNDPSRADLRMSYRHTKPIKTSSSRPAGHSRSRQNYHRGSAHDPFGTAH